MKRQFNLTTSSCDLERYPDQDALIAMMDGFDGVELQCFEEDVRHVVPKDRVVGLHMTNIPYWLDFWNGDMDACVREFDTQENCYAYFGGETREALVERFRRDLRDAERYEAEYVVFHVFNSTFEEAITGRYRHTDAEVIDATCELLNELLPPDYDGPTLLMENLWESGFTFTDPAMTRHLLNGVEYPRTGLMLDTGHLMHTRLSLRSQEDAVAYINEMLDIHGDLCEKVRGIHLNQSITGAYMQRMMDNPPEMRPTYMERCGQMYEYVFNVDKHLPFTCPGVRELVERIAPDYLTFEFITGDREEHWAKLQEQKRVFEDR